MRVPKFTAIIIVFVFSGLFIPTWFDQAVGSSTFSALPQQFPLPPPELFATQKTASTNLTCTLTPSLIEVEGTPHT